MLVFRSLRPSEEPHLLLFGGGGVGVAGSVSGILQDKSRMISLADLPAPRGRRP